MYYEFQSCDNDTIDYISLEHNADIALRNEGQKWFQWFSKECRNLNRLSAQLIRVQALMSEGHKVILWVCHSVPFTLTCYGVSDGGGHWWGTYGH